MSNLQIVEKTINILDGVNWAAYGDHQTADYPAYIRGQHSDEASLMDGLLGEFLEQVLGFTLHQDLHPQMTAQTTGKRPDYIPDDTHLHPFVFDAKGSDTTDLGQHYDQIAGYVRGKGLRYGVLANMRHLAVYTLHSRQPEADYSFSFRQLYEDYRQDPAAALEAQNTQRFLAFVQHFRHRELDRAGKVQAIVDARHGPHDAELDLDDLVRRLHEIVAVLHEDVHQQRPALLQTLRYSNERKTRIVLEIDDIAREIAPATPGREVKAATLKRLLSTPAATTDGQATDRYLYRVAYFAMTRILLARVWEDIGFIEQTLYDGGFKHWYEWLGNEVQRVLSQAFHFANERYSWLYGAENNYTWYTPSEKALVDVLYNFSRFDFRYLDADVLGAVYEAYLDETDRKNKGQYYTPRPMVQFLWDRVGFDAPSEVFRFEGGERQPRVVIDFCTGSGGFLVEAARRVREIVLGTDFNHEDSASLEAVGLDDLALAMRAIIEGLRGSEINAFAYYLTEVNLLIQLTPVITAIRKKAPRALHFGRDYALSVIHQDALKLHNRPQRSLITTDGDMVEDFVQKDEMYEQDRRYDIVSLSGFKRTVYAWLKEERQADYVCSNPPYVGEKGHKELFRYYREQFEYWDNYYQGKMDYFYWFVILGLSKLRDGGRLGYITTSYWPTADGAATLRRYILEHAKIVEMIDFGETRIFSDAHGQHNMVFVLERCDDAEARAANCLRLVRVKREFEGKTIEERLSRLLNHIRGCIDITPGKAFEDDYINVFWSPATQSSLNDGTWNVFVRDRTAAILAKMQRAGVSLGKVFEVKSGVDCTASKVTSRHLELLPARTQARVGDGIFVLTQKEYLSLRLSGEESTYVKPFFKNSDIGRYCVDRSEQENRYLLYIDWNTSLEKDSSIYQHLKTYWTILQDQVDRYGESYKWYQLHRSRERWIFEGEKIVVPQRAPSNIFGYSDEVLYSSRDVYYIVASPKVPESLKYVCGVLNSKLVLLWLLNKGKRKGKALELYHTPLTRIPIRRIQFDPSTDETIKQAALNNLKAHLDAGNYDAAYTALHQALNAGQEDVVHDGLVELVDQIIALKTDLATYNRYFGTRLTRLEEDDPLPELEPLAVLQGLPASEQWSADIHIQNGTLTIRENLSGERDDFYFYRVKESTATSITLRARGHKAGTLTLSGDPALIDYLKAVLPAQQDRFWRDVKKTLAPKDVTVYQNEAQRIIQAVTEIRRQVIGRQVVINQIVLDLYGITAPDDRKLISGKSG
jgi:hypothetical protein